MFYWKNLTVDVRNYVQQCVECKSCKAENQCLRPSMGKSPDCIRAWQNLFIDYLGPYPRSSNNNSFIFIVLDQYSRFVLLQAMRVATAAAAIKYLEKYIFCVFGVP